MNKIFLVLLVLFSGALSQATIYTYKCDLNTIGYGSAKATYDGGRIYYFKTIMDEGDRKYIASKSPDMSDYTECKVMHFIKEEYKEKNPNSFDAWCDLDKHTGGYNFNSKSRRYRFPENGAVGYLTCGKDLDL